MVVKKGLGGDYVLGLGWGPRGPPHLGTGSEPERTRGYRGPLLATQAWEHVGGGMQVWAGPPQLTPKGWRQQATERVMNNLLAVWTQVGCVQVGQPNYPSHNARRHVEYVMLGALKVMLG